MTVDFIFITTIEQRFQNNIKTNRLLENMLYCLTWQTLCLEWLQTKIYDRPKYI